MQPLKFLNSPETSGQHVVENFIFFLENFKLNNFHLTKPDIKIITEKINIPRFINQIENFIFVQRIPDNGLVFCFVE